MALCNVMALYNVLAPRAVVEGPCDLPHASSKDGRIGSFPPLRVRLVHFLSIRVSRVRVLPGRFGRAVLCVGVEARAGAACVDCPRDTYAQKRDHAPRIARGGSRAGKVSKTWKIRKNPDHGSRKPGKYAKIQTMHRVNLGDLPRAPQSSVSALVFLFRLCWSSQAPPPLPPAFRWLSTSRAVHLAALAAELRPQNAGFPEASRIIPAHTCTF